MKGFGDALAAIFLRSPASYCISQDQQKNRKFSVRFQAPALVNIQYYSNMTSEVK